MIICKKNNWLFFSETRRYHCQEIDWETTRIRFRPILLFDNARLQKLPESKYEILQIFHQIDCHSFLHLRLFFQQNKIFDAESQKNSKNFFSLKPWSFIKMERVGWNLLFGKGSLKPMHLDRTKIIVSKIYCSSSKNDLTIVYVVRRKESIENDPFFLHIL